MNAEPPLQPSQIASPPRSRIRRGQLLAFLACGLSIGIFGAFNNYTLTLWLSGMTSSYLLLGLVGNSRSFEGTIVGPLTGFASDHVWLGWLGRRRPFILVCGTVSSLLLALTPLLTRLAPAGAAATILGMAPRLAMAVLVDFLFTLTWDAVSDTHDALLVDISSRAERDRVSALRTVATMAGQVGILVVGALLWKSTVPDSAFVLTGLLMAAGMLVTVLFVREPDPSVWRRSRRLDQDEKPAHRSLRAFLRRYHGAAVFCLVAFCYWAGVNAILPLLSIYIRDILHATTGEAQLLPALLLLSTTLLALPMAKLGDRFGKRRVISAGFAVMACIGVTGLLITTKEQGAIVLLIAGAGNAASMVLTVPLLADLVPPERIGTATGILAGSGSLAAPVASLIAGSLANVYGPRVIFLLMSVTVTAALLLMPLVRAPKSEE